MLPSRWIWSEKWLRRYIISKLKQDLSTRCCAIFDSITGIGSASTPQWFAAVEQLFEVESLSTSSNWSNVNCYFKSFQTLNVDILVWNQLKTSVKQQNSSRYFSMHSIVALVRYWYCATWSKYAKFVMHNRASAKEIIWLTEGFESVTAKTGTITCPSAFFSLPLHCDASPY
jgi:hypothetical protein